MASSMKYLGAATEDGEWWHDRGSEATDLGPGVKFSIRCAEDGGNGPHVVKCKGLKEDVRIDRIRAEAERLLAEYQKPTEEYPDGRALQGALQMPTLDCWRSLDEVLDRLRGSWSLRGSKHANLAAGKMVWSLEDILWDCTGYMPMTERVIELAGIKKIQEIYDSVEVA